MEVIHTAKTLIAFEDEIAKLFEQKRIKAPVHLSGGNEHELIGIFRNHIDPEDWALCSWRAHYACLLKGVPKRKLRQAILDGKSISLCFPEYKILSSAIVGGIAPIAVGLAMGIKRRQGRHKVVCFIGDMTAESGIWLECAKYSVNHSLPVLWVVEDNGLSVCTDTALAWGGHTTVADKSILRYEYTMTRPHVGIGKWVKF